jgi:hypothetical protein
VPNVADIGNLFPAARCEYLPDSDHLHLGAVAAQGQDVARLDGLSTLGDFRDRVAPVAGQALIADGDLDRRGCAQQRGRE